jgi:rhodanese-related sulfurtransferase
MLFGTKSVDVKTASARNESGVMLVDVRTKPEWREGHAPGATHLSLDSLPNRSEWLKRAVGDRQLLVICRSGNRSGRAVRHLRSLGLAAFNVKGGMIAWQRAGLPVKRG